MNIVLYFTLRSSVSYFNFEEVNVGWVVTVHPCVIFLNALFILITASKTTKLKI